VALIAGMNLYAYSLDGSKSASVTLGNLPEKNAQIEVLISRFGPGGYVYGSIKEIVWREPSGALQVKKFDVNALDSPPGLGISKLNQVTFHLGVQKAYGSVVCVVREN